MEIVVYLQYFKLLTLIASAIFFPFFVLLLLLLLLKERVQSRCPKNRKVVYRVLRIRIYYREYIKKSSFRVSYEQKTPYLNGMPFSCEPDPASPG